jgi:hypothetical protein
VCVCGERERERERESSCPNLLLVYLALRCDCGNITTLPIQVAINPPSLVWGKPKLVSHVRGCRLLSCDSDSQFTLTVGYCDWNSLPSEVPTEQAEDDNEQGGMGTILPPNSHRVQYSFLLRS